MTHTQRIISALVTASLAAALLGGCSSDTDIHGAASASTEGPPAQDTAPAGKPDADASGNPSALTTTARPCFNPHGGMCLGMLEAGTYRTQVFKPGIRYTVPQDWVNGEDLPGNFLLYREEDPQDGFVGGSYIGIYTDIHAPKRCEEAWQGGVGHRPADLASWYLQHPGLETSQARKVEVGGLQGLLVDVPLQEDWRARCPWSQGLPVVPVIIGSGVSDLYHVSLHELDVRLLLLSWKDTNVTIEITSVKDQHSREEYLDMVMPIITSLRFQRN